MKKNAINLKDKLSKFHEFWSPYIISELNDYQIKLAKIQGEFIWHNHPETDELFIVVFGSMRLEFRDSFVDLTEGDIYVVPKGIDHKPIAENECHIMLIEPKGTKNTGNNSFSSRTTKAKFLI